MIIDSVPLNSGGAILVSVTNGGAVMMTGPETAILNMVEVDWLVDVLCFAKTRAKPLLTECSDGPLVRGNSTPSAPQG